MCWHHLSSCTMHHTGWSQSPVRTQVVFPPALKPSGWITYIPPAPPGWKNAPGRIYCFFHQSLLRSTHSSTTQHSIQMAPHWPPPPLFATWHPNCISAGYLRTWICQSVCLCGNSNCGSLCTESGKSWPGQRQPDLPTAQRLVWLLLLCSAQSHWHESCSKQDDPSEAGLPLCTNLTAQIAQCANTCLIRPIDTVSGRHLPLHSCHLCQK